MQLTIQDGGANDSDGLRDYIVKDTDGLALAHKLKKRLILLQSGRLESRLKIKR